MVRYIAIFVLCLWSAAAFADPANDHIVESETAFIGIVVVSPWAGARSVAQLWNPPESGKSLYVDRIEWAHSLSGPGGCDIRAYSQVYGTLRENPFNKKLGGPASVAEARWGNTPGGQLIGDILYECWRPKGFDDTGYTFDPAIIVPPGKGVVVAAANDGAHLIVSFQFREKPSE
jgi:hypothetical protein